MKTNKTDLKKKRRIWSLVFIIFILLVIYIWPKTHKIPKRILKEYVCYHPKEVLVYTSNEGEHDTIFITGSDSYISGRDPLAIIQDKYEFFKVDGGLLSFYFHERRRVRFVTNFQIYNTATFYGAGGFYIEELEEMPFHKVMIQDRIYDDVWIFEATDREYEDRDDFIEKLYWSKSYGAIKFEMKNNVIWILSNRYKI